MVEDTFSRPGVSNSVGNNKLNYFVVVEKNSFWENSDWPQSKWIQDRSIEDYHAIAPLWGKANQIFTQASQLLLMQKKRCFSGCRVVFSVDLLPFVTTFAANL